MITKYHFLRKHVNVINNGYKLRKLQIGTIKLTMSDEQIRR